MILSIVGLGIGVILLAFASDQFVIGAARIALVAKIAPLVVGVVIVGFGTSSPEFLVSASAAIGGQSAIGVGNIVGSNVVNLSLILGMGVLILPVAIDSRTVRLEAPLAVAGMVLFAVLLADGLAVYEGVALILAMVGVIAVVLRRRSDDPLASDTVDFAGSEHRLGTEIWRVGLGLTGTVAGAQILLVSAVDIAESAGLSKGFVGATIVAIGTSLPELVTVVQSARRGEGDLIVGNLLGSNLFNALAVGGVVGLLGGSGVGDQTSAWMAASAGVVVGLVVWGLMRTGRRLSRVEGAVLVALYAAAFPFLAA